MDRAISSPRFTVGASLRAQIDVGSIITWMQTGTVVGEHITVLTGYLMTPIVITSQTTLRIEEYAVNDVAYNLILLGAVAEIQGKTLEA